LEKGPLGVMGFPELFHALVVSWLIFLYHQGAESQVQIKDLARDKSRATQGQHIGSEGQFIPQVQRDAVNCPIEQRARLLGI
jgi:hypothetical protein